MALGTWLAPSTALVVGNGACAAIGTLPNPGNDAADVASARGRLGFDVSNVRDADRAGTNEALPLFAGDSAGGGRGGGVLRRPRTGSRRGPLPGAGRRASGAGHRRRIRGAGARPGAAGDGGCEFAGCDPGRVPKQPAGAFHAADGGASRSATRGSLGELDEGRLGDETLVAYAAAAGTMAADGMGRNSPYTAALLTYLERPLEIGILFREVRARVLESTGGEQRPHEYASLLANYLGGASGPGTGTVADNVSSPALAQQETEGRAGAPRLT